ncbi:MAG: TonB-dependent receptor [Pseudomonadota bacterium]
MSKMNRSLAGLVSAGLLTTIGSMPAKVQAQTAEADDAIDVITVTSRKREELITDVPIAISAFDAEKIESLGLQNISDLQAVTPGFQYERFAGIPGRFDNSPRFRGISVNSLAPSRQTASVFVDGIFVSNGIQGIGLEDIERIEVIKGPQSAYFGRLTFGGAVNYVTRSPGDEMRINVTGMAATRDDYSLQASIEGPIIGDVLSGRLSASYADDGGHFDTALTGDEVGQERTTSIGGTLFFTPTEGLEIKVRGYYYENDDGAPAYAFLGLDDHNCGPFGGPDDDTTVCGDANIVAPDLNVQIGQGLRDRVSGLPTVAGSNLTEIGLKRESLRLSTQFSWDIPDTNLTVSGLFGVNEEDVRLLRDADDSSDESYFSYAGRNFEDSSYELRLAGLNFNDRLSWSIGVNQFDQEFTNNGGFLFAPFGNLPFGSGAPVTEEVSTFGIFGSASYDVSESVRLTVEARQQTDEITDESDSGEFDNLLPRVIAEWTPTDDALLYASYSEGNLPGGFNPEVAALNATELAELRTFQSSASGAFEEEKLENFELGWKQTWADGRGVTTLAVFHMNRTNQTFRRADVIADLDDPSGQQQIDYFINAGESKIDGLEFEGEYQFTEMFRLEGTLAWIRSEYDVFNSGVHNELFGTEDAGGKTAERFPEWASSLSGVFAGNLNAEFDWFGRADLFYTGERFADEGNLVQAAGGAQVNLRAGLQSDKYRVELFVLNATDDDTPTAINRFRDLSFATGNSNFGNLNFSTFGYQVGLRDRRQVGLRASVNFR